MLSTIIRGALACACAGFISIGAVQAQAPASALDAIQSAGALRICTTGDYKPFTNATGDSFEGIDIEMAKSLAQAIGVEPKFVRTKWAELMADFTGGKCDVAMGGIGVTLERQKRVFYSEPALRTGKIPLVRCADKDKFQSVADIDKPGVTAIANPGGTNERFAKSNFKQAKITLHPDNVGIFDEILAGRADVFVTEAIEATVQQKLKPGLCAINPDKPLTFIEIGYLLPRGDVIFKAFVDQWLHIAKATGEYQRYYEQYLR
ncbi:transporter substrate-binding domain-containing protein [Bosea sp. (in: a-proteobacteria)]|uniref:transporter substrate-binding domain-containing protein n=1 Tax=Bosea sp. (in: a-proteobacteria) TaxID=1871050 RepID=UPI001DA50E82|nr:transporter substrate-binding domain-containing protein [Bosea sp. (in: a-proteobacteria)]MBA4223726.1 ArtI protein [Methylobacterium sp.]MBR3191010.1 transporter substrate-binding domain-containing protein [Bosea sp. (in: a-proteobacteria)]